MRVAVHHELAFVCFTRTKPIGLVATLGDDLSIATSSIGTYPVFTGAVANLEPYARLLFRFLIVSSLYANLSLPSVHIFDESLKCH